MDSVYRDIEQPGPIGYPHYANTIQILLLITDGDKYTEFRRNMHDRFNAIIIFLHPGDLPGIEREVVIKG